MYCDEVQNQDLFGLAIGCTSLLCLSHVLLMPIDASWLKKTKQRLGADQRADAGTEYQAFRTRVLNVLRDNLEGIKQVGIRQFYQVLSRHCRYKETPIGARLDPAVIYEELAGAPDTEFLFLLQVVLELPFYRLGDFVGVNVDPWVSFIGQLKEAIRMSDVDVKLTVTGEHAIIHPRGEKELESHLVDGALSVLQGAASSHFTDALKLYGKGTPADRVKSADALRRTLEEYLRTRLSNTKGLNGNITALLSILKQSGRDRVVRNIIFQTFSYLDEYFNENSKHADGDIDAAENEFLVYQAGLLIVYVDRALQRH
jgi:hypothetical protein